MPPSLRMQKAVNRWAGRIIPLILLALVAYSIYVVIASIAVGYLLNHPSFAPKQTGAGIAVLIVYSVILLLMLASFLRVIQVVIMNPGLVPKADPNPGSSQKRLDSSGVSDASTDKADSGVAPTPSDKVGFLDRRSIFGGSASAPPGLEQFYLRDVFECEVDGLPRLCSNCRTWKPDRSHHCSEIDRCVFKMDHFCPWAGGIISETSFKFFTLFCLYSSLLCAFIIIVSACFLAQTARENGPRNVNWIVMTIISAFFFVFSAAIWINSMRFILTNSTTVDSLTQKSRIHYFAILLPSTSQGYSFDHGPNQPNNSLNQTQTDTSAAVGHSEAPAHPFTTVTYPLRNSNLDQPSRNIQPRTFAVLATPPGANAYRLPSMFENFKSVMGEHWYEWALPLRYSPCCNHRNRDLSAERGQHVAPMYRLGPVIEQMKRDAGIVSESVDSEKN